MNRYFEDAVYYLKRAGEATKRGVRQEVAPAESKVRELTGREKEPEPTRVERVKDELRTAEGEAKKRLGSARKSFGE